MFHNATNQRNMKIEGYENYEVTCSGEVINTTTGKVLKPFNNGWGYLYVSLSKNGKVKKYKVHRLVAEAFIPNPLNLPCINHKDENPLNNNVENLEWCTHEYNNNYGTHNERISKAMKNGKTSKTVLQLRMDGSLVCVWPSVNEIYRKLGYFYGNISQCCRGERHSAYGYKWCYAKQ